MFLFSLEKKSESINDSRECDWITGFRLLMLMLVGADQITGPAFDWRPAWAYRFHEPDTLLLLPFPPEKIECTSHHILLLIFPSYSIPALHWYATKKTHSIRPDSSSFVSRCTSRGNGSNIFIFVPLCLVLCSSTSLSSCNAAVTRNEPIKTISSYGARSCDASFTTSH